MKTVIRIIGVLALLVLLAACVFGFLATFEPLDADLQLIWRVAYGLTGLACLAGIAFLARPRK
jgi:hypothetical protein